MRIFSLSWLLFFLLFFSTLAQAGPYDPRHKWHTVKTEHFAIHYYEGEEKVVERLLKISEEAYGILSKKFDATPWGRTEIVVVDQEDASNAFASVIPYNMIQLRVVAPKTDSDIGDYDEWLREVFLHEFTHIIHISDTRYPAKALKWVLGKPVAPNGISPGWVTEGIAVYFETVLTTRGRGRASSTEMLLRTDILRDKFLELDQMAGSQYSWPGWRAQYLYGGAFWKYLAETYGEEKIVEFSHKYGASLWLYALNHKAKKVFGKNFHALWHEWKGSLQKKYGEVKARIEREGIREGEKWLTPKKGESLSQPLFSPDGKRLVYVASSIHRPLEIRLREVESGREKILLKRKEPGQLAWSPDQKTIVYSQLAEKDVYYRYSDLYRFDLETRKTKPITKRKRARDPDFSPDGKRLVCVLQETGWSRLALYDLEKKEFVNDWGEEGISFGTEFNNPRWSPDGKTIVVSVHEGGERDLWFVDAATGQRKRKITDGPAIEERPAWGGDGAILYSSDRDGISNLYRMDPVSGTDQKLTHLLTGAFAPTVGATGEIGFQYYNGTGYEVRKFSSPLWKKGLSGGLLQGPAELARLRRAQTGPRPLPQPPSVPFSPGKPYSPFRKLFVPRYFLPDVLFIDNALFLAGTIGNFDPLERHDWFGEVNYRTDNQFIGYAVEYNYRRFHPDFFVGATRYSVDFGDLFQTGDSFFEKRQREYGGIGWSHSSHRLSTSYFFEERSVESGLPAGQALNSLGNYSGIHSRYRFSTLKGTAASISDEEGVFVALNTELTDSVLAASENLEQQVFWGDLRHFVHLGRHHVIALRGTGGAAFGDRLIQGNFGVGGSLGESLFTGASTRLFTLRGLPLVAFSVDRAWVSSAEYRFPLFYSERGLGTLPVALNAGHFALFADFGDVYARRNPRSRPLLGVGAELRGEFVLGYYLPVTGRLGYGIIVTNRDRLAPFTDPYTGAGVSNGILILEVGTSF